MPIQPQPSDLDCDEWQRSTDGPPQRLWQEQLRAHRDRPRVQRDFDTDNCRLEGRGDLAADRLRRAPSFEQALAAELNEVFVLLCEKNKAYGNSALDPVRVFSRASATEQLRVRIDDKLSRLQRGDPNDNEDTKLDLVGYLLLLRLAEKSSTSSRRTS